MNDARVPGGHEKREKRIREAFEISIVLKGVNAALEVVLGVALLFTAQIADVLSVLIQNELVEDPGDFLARHAEQLVPFLTPDFRIFGSLYLLSHGVVKGVLVWGLLRNKLWAYPASLFVFALFILYQIVKWFDSHSLFLLLLTLFDLAVMWLIWHEYRYMSARRISPMV